MPEMALYEILRGIKSFNEAVHKANACFASVSVNISSNHLGLMKTVIEYLSPPFYYTEFWKENAVMTVKILVNPQFGNTCSISFFHQDIMIHDKEEESKYEETNYLDLEGNELAITNSIPGKVYDDGLIRVVFNLLSGTIIVLDRKESQILIIGRQPREMMTDCEQVIRGIITHHLLARKFFLVHGGAIASNDNAILVVGAKGSGKTTLVASMLANGYDYIANDRAFVWRESNQFFVGGWPTTFNLGLGTLFSNKKLNTSFPAQLKLYADSHPGSLNRTKILLMPHEVSRVFPTKPKSESMLKALVFTKLSLRETYSQIRRLSAQEVHSMLPKHILLYDKAHPNWLELQTDERSITMNFRMFRKAIAREISGFMLNIGTNIERLVNCVEQIAR